MADVSVLPGFIAVILLFLIPPGPDMAYMLAVGLAGGRAAAAKAILGIGTGMAVYAIAVVVGVGRLAQTYPLLLDVVKVLGALYLLWLAYSTIRGARRSIDSAPEIATERPYIRGVIVSLTNPKVILFFMAVLPQFLGEATQPELQLAMLGAVNVGMEVLLYGAIGVGAGVFHSRFSESPRAGAVLHYVAAAVYIVLALTIIGEVSIGLMT
ncbi:LysE family translocator [Plantibacter sp. CFBP 8804]|uniref:LysE family translocator n=1 Tax=Plantibacter sp. CFBP 8804 TaxID=2775270 RepID=UPI001783FCA4|nr:LysE family translocator [Plantibacter sp. CFBP 8804]MBD8518899.1 LysE family translocator [Plantibacter sp. CFBP 8804]